MLDKDSINNEISVGVTFASLMAAISLFFTGAIVAQYSSFGATIKVPLLMLIVSTFSFIFAATIYNNAGSEVTLGKMKTVEKYMIYAKNIVEFLGLYPLILATPLVIGALTDDNFLRISTTFVAVVGIALYSQSKFSILERQLPRRMKQLYSLAIVGIALLLYLAQTSEQFDTASNYSMIAVFLLVFLVVPTVYFSQRSHQYRVISVRAFKDSDVIGLARLIAKHKKQRTADEGHDYSEAGLRKLAARQQMYVAVIGNRRVGLISLEGNLIHSIYSDASLHRKGIGRMLVDTAELAAAEAGYEEIEVLARPESARFFKKIGFVKIGKPVDGEIKFRKEL